MRYLIDRIEGDTIILYDSGVPGKKTLKQMVIFDRHGKKRLYRIERTRSDNYLMQ